MRLTAAFEACERSVVRLLYKLWAEKSVAIGSGTYTAADFANEWTQGGKKYLEDKWRDSANAPTGRIVGEDMTAEDVEPDGERELFQGKHEWIPTNMLGYVVESALLHQSDIRWIFLAEVLRIPTRLVVVSPVKMHRPDKNLNPMGITGHVGAVYVEKNGESKPIFKGQATFHNELRALLKQCLSSSANNIDAYRNGLAAHINNWYWLGDMNSVAAFFKLSPTDFGKLPCPYSYLSDVNTCTSFGATMGDMARNLAEGWAVWQQAAANQFNAVYELSTTVPKNTANLSVVVPIEDGFMDESMVMDESTH